MLVALGLIIALLLIVLFSNRATRHCRWREFPGPELSEWRCVNCGAQKMGPRGRPPRLCLKDHD